MKLYWKNVATSQNVGDGSTRCKRRNRCTKCAPCQITKDCGSCTNCKRRSVGKQACIFRQCVEVLKLKKLRKYRSKPSAAKSVKAKPEVAKTLNPSMPPTPPPSQINAAVTSRRGFEAMEIDGGAEKVNGGDKEEMLSGRECKPASSKETSLVLCEPHLGRLSHTEILLR